MKRPILLILAFTAAAPVAMPAFADRPTSVEVRFSDLDLNQPGGAAAMLGRLDQAAMQACGAAPFASLREYRQAIRGSRCYARSLDRAVSDLNAPEVTAMYARRASAAE